MCFLFSVCNLFSLVKNRADIGWFVWFSPKLSDHAWLMDNLVMICVHFHCFTQFALRHLYLLKTFANLCAFIILGLGLLNFVGLGKKCVTWVWFCVCVCYRNFDAICNLCIWWCSAFPGVQKHPEGRGSIAPTLWKNDAKTCAHIRLCSGGAACCISFGVVVGRGWPMCNANAIICTIRMAIVTAHQFKFPKRFATIVGPWIRIVVAEKRGSHATGFVFASATVSSLFLLLLLSVVGVKKRDWCVCVCVCECVFVCRVVRCGAVWCGVVWCGVCVCVCDVGGGRQLRCAKYSTWSIMPCCSKCCWGAGFQTRMLLWSHDCMTTKKQRSKIDRTTANSTYIVAQNEEIQSAQFVLIEKSNLQCGDSTTNPLSMVGCQMQLPKTVDRFHFCKKLFLNRRFA